MKVFFISGFFPDNQKDFILNNSKGVIQNAAHVYQGNLLKGLDAVYESGVEVINLPFVGSWPTRFKRLYFPSCKVSAYGRNSCVRGIGFLNFPIIKHFARFLSLFSVLVKEKKQDHFVFMVYCAHLPFIAGVVLAKKIKFHKSKVCLIVPDLPEFMSEETGFFYRFFKALDSFLIMKLIRHVDSYVLLTDAMAEKLGVEQDSYIVVEGIANNNSEVSQAESLVSDKKIIFYSGTLAARYGVRDLVDAFREVPLPSCELWICGEGDSRGYIESAARQDGRIKYYGQLSQEKVINLQRQSTVLVNPRLPFGEFTKYSFPSKVMEYMASGRPVVMHRLPGIPSEYFRYCFTPELSDMKSLKECLVFVLGLSMDRLNDVGRTARQFVLDNKSCVSQAYRIKTFLEREANAK